MLEDVAPLIGAMLAATWGRGDMTERSAAKRMAKFRLGHWFMIPIAFVEERGSRTGNHLTRPGRGRRRMFEIRVNASSQGGVRLGWWDAGRLGPFPDLIHSDQHIELGGGTVALQARTAGLGARIELQEMDLAILREVLSR